MLRYLRAILMSVAACGLVGSAAEAQVASKTQAVDPAASIRQALSLAEGSGCAEELPVLKRSTQGLQDRHLRYLVAFAAVR